MKRSILFLGFLLLCMGCVVGQAGVQTPKVGRGGKKGKGGMEDGVHVLHVDGKVTGFSRASAIGVGDVLLPDDELKFEGGSRLVLWDKVGGLREVKAGPDACALVVSKAARPAALPTGRAISRFRYLAELKAHFDGRAYLILGKSWLVAEAGIRPQGDSVLLVKFRNYGENYQASTKLPFHGDTLVIDPGQFLQASGKPVPADQAGGFELWLYGKTNKVAEQLASFQLLLPDMDRLRSEYLYCKEFFTRQGLSAEALQAQLYLFVVAAYGEPDPHNYYEWSQGLGK